MNSIHFVISGKVQGVFFRANTKTKAEELDIKGWVKNTEEGNVEVLAQGNPDNLLQFEEWCRQGPSRARVDAFRKADIEAPAFDSFTIDRD